MWYQSRRTSYREMDAAQSGWERRDSLKSVNELLNQLRAEIREWRVENQAWKECVFSNRCFAKEDKSIDLATCESRSRVVAQNGQLQDLQSEEEKSDFMPYHLDESGDLDLALTRDEGVDDVVGESSGEAALSILNKEESYDLGGSTDGESMKESAEEDRLQDVMVNFSQNFFSCEKINKFLEDRFCSMSFVSMCVSGNASGYESAAIQLNDCKIKGISDLLLLPGFQHNCSNFWRLCNLIWSWDVGESESIYRAMQAPFMWSGCKRQSSFLYQVSRSQVFDSRFLEEAGCLSNHELGDEGWRMVAITVTKRDNLFWFKLHTTNELKWEGENQILTQGNCLGQRTTHEPPRTDGLLGFFFSAMREIRDSSEVGVVRKVNEQKLKAKEQAFFSDNIDVIAISALLFENTVPGTSGDLSCLEVLDEQELIELRDMLDWFEGEDHSVLMLIVSSENYELGDKRNVADVYNDDQDVSVLSCFFGMDVDFSLPVHNTQSDRLDSFKRKYCEDEHECCNQTENEKPPLTKLQWVLVLKAKSDGRSTCCDNFCSAGLVCPTTSELENHAWSHVLETIMRHCNYKVPTTLSYLICSRKRVFICPIDDYIVSGSDGGHMFIWKKKGRMNEHVDGLYLAFVAMHLASDKSYLSSSGLSNFSTVLLVLKGNFKGAFPVYPEEMLEKVMKMYISYQEDYWKNSKGVMQFTCRWLSSSSGKVLVFLFHGHGMQCSVFMRECECSVFMRGCGVRLAEADYVVFDIDKRGHGRFQEPCCFIKKFYKQALEILRTRMNLEDFTSLVRSWFNKRQGSKSLCGMFTEISESELAVFTSYGLAFPYSFLALVDTYEVIRTVALALNDLGYKAAGIRWDFCDLTYLSIECRKAFCIIKDDFEKEGFVETQISASNDINEETLDVFHKQGHEIDLCGSGMCLVTCYAQEALGCVVKFSENVSKVSIPCTKNLSNLGVVIQCITIQRVTNQYLTNVLVKINAKMLPGIVIDSRTMSNDHVIAFSFLRIAKETSCNLELAFVDLSGNLLPSFLLSCLQPRNKKRVLQYWRNCGVNSTQAQHHRTLEWWTENWHVSVPLEISRLVCEPKTFLWAESINFQTIIGSFVMLIQYGDMLNHSFRPNYFFHWRFKDRMLEVMINADQAIRKGDEMTIKGMNGKNETLVKHYKFSSSTYSWDMIKFFGHLGVYLDFFLSIFVIASICDEYYYSRHLFGEVEEPFVDGVVIVVASSLLTWLDVNNLSLLNDERKSCQRLYGVSLTDLNSTSSILSNTEISLITSLNVWFGILLAYDSFHAGVYRGNLWLMQVQTKCGHLCLLKWFALLRLVLLLIDVAGYAVAGIFYPSFNNSFGTYANV